MTHRTDVQQAYVDRLYEAKGLIAQIEGKYLLDTMRANSPWKENPDWGDVGSLERLVGLLKQALGEE